MISKNFEAFSNNKSLISGIQNNLKDLKRNFDMLRKLTEEPGSQKNFDTAINAFYYIFDHIPLPGPYLDSTELSFFRARANDRKNVLFNQVTDISYNSTKPEVIKEGRFNQYQEAVFYASLPVEGNNLLSSMAAILETCKGLTSQHNPVHLKDFTIGRWKVIKPFYVVNFCFDEEHLIVNPPIKRQVDEYLKAIRACLNKESSDFVLEFLAYFSALSGKRTEQKFEYYVLTAMFYAIQIYYSKNAGIRMNGLIYPSAMTEKKGLNIVLTTFAVDEHLRPDKVGMYRFKLEGNTYNGEPCCDAVDIDGDKFTITGFKKNPPESLYTIECESKTGGPLMQSRD